MFSILFTFLVSVCYGGAHGEAEPGTLQIGAQPGQLKQAL